LLAAPSPKVAVFFWLLPCHTVGMASVTDPARELAEIAAKFDVGSSLRADQVITSSTGFQAWSTQFHQLVASIHERADLVGRMLPRSGLDPDLVDDALRDITEFKRGFQPSAIGQASNHSGSTAAIMRMQGRPMQYLSIAVRQFESYPRYTQEEAIELVALIDEYLEHLSVHGDSLAFVLSAIREGLAALRFRLANVTWVGSGYALQSLRDVMFIHREAAADEHVMSNPDAEAFVRGFGVVIGRVLQVVKSAKDYSEASSWAFKAARIGGPAAMGYLLAAPK
jgi:hypothetical protein